MTTERPILMNAPMVRATLREVDPKTQTRRVCKPAMKAALERVIAIQNPEDFGQRPLEVVGSGWFGDEEGDVQFFCPYGKPGDRLWVRESWAYNPDLPGIAARACFMADPEHEHDGMKWKPSIHMPRAVCRILLEVVSVRVERLQAISEADCIVEGCKPIDGGIWWKNYTYPFGFDGKPTKVVGYRTAKESYRSIWTQINGSGSWAANPHVWAIEFKRLAP